MDLCSGILVAIIVIVILKMLMDSSAVRMSRGGNTCGMRAVTDTDAATSSEPVPIDEGEDGGESSQKKESGSLVSAGRATMDKISPPQAEGTPAQEALTYDTWSGKESHFGNGVKAVKEQAKKGVNTRSLNPDTEITQPSYARTLGMTTPILEVLGQCSKTTPVQHGKACAWFGGSEAYFQSRKKSGNECGPGDALKPSNC